MNSNKQFDTPILFLTYHRPNETEKVWREIEKLKPKRLFISHGAPNNNSGDKELCDKTKMVTESIGWNCEIHRFHEKNNIGGGPANRVAIDWFFSQVDEGIIFEDDCVPNQSFFPFCAEMLERYRKNPRVMLISGDNFLRKGMGGSASYHFSLYPLMWGWATWKRVWKLYDFDMKTLRTGGSDKIKKTLRNDKEREYWLGVIEREYTRKHAFDYQMAYAIWINGGLCITPNVNLITNIGFGAGATNTNNPHHTMGYIPTQSMHFPLIHPTKITINDKADDFVFRHYYLKVFGIKGHTRRFLLDNAPNSLIKFIRLIKNIPKTIA